MAEVRFASSNEQKIDETRSILNDLSIELKPVSLKIEEVQTKDTCRLVRSKAREAFRRIERPLFVEHTSLSLHQFDGLPDGFDSTFSEPGEKKNHVAMRRLPLNTLTKFLNSGRQHV